MENNLIDNLLSQRFVCRSSRNMLYSFLKIEPKIVSEIEEAIEESDGQLSVHKQAV